MRHLHACLRGLAAVSTLAVACADTHPLRFGAAPWTGDGAPFTDTDKGAPSGAPGGPDTGPPPAPPVVPETGHPRLWIRPSDLDRLRSWATPENPMYAEGLAPAVAAAEHTYDTQFFPNGAPNPSWPDPGTINWTLYVTEAYAEIFAFMSLIDPDPSARPAHAARARNLIMHAFDEAAKGPAAGQPFRDPVFSTNNRASWWGEAFGLTVDWIYPSLTAEDKATIQKVFLRWSDECVHAATTNEEHPQPIGAMNDPSLLADKRQLRWAANNYFTAHMRQLTLMSLALDDADDPPVDPSKPASALGNTMRSYLADVTGAWLYQQFAVYSDAAVAASALGVPPDGLGVASGGLPVEGSLYGGSIGSLHEALLALHTAGRDDPAIVGPQAMFWQSPYWDKNLQGFLHTITPVPVVPTDHDHRYLGPVYGMASYGDLEKAWIGPNVGRFGSLGILDQVTGNQARLPALRWIAKNVLQGGADALYQRASDVWGNSYATDAIQYFMLFDPAAPEPADPRPALPTVFFDRALGRALARNAFTPDATWFTYLCNWETINHQLGSANQIELYRKGEWLLKERGGYCTDFVEATSDEHDTLAVENDKPSNLEWFEGPTSARGGQWTNGMNTGDPKVLMSQGPGWVYAYGDATNLYNRPGDPWEPNGTSALDVVHASRSVVWIEPDHVVVYDRADTHKANRFKRDHFTLVAQPQVSGHTATALTAGGQRLTLETLLPADATLTASPADAFNSVAELEPTQWHLMIEDPSKPASVRFLHVFEAADAGAPTVAATLVESTSGTAFEGASLAWSSPSPGAAVTMFPVDADTPFQGTSYVVPAGATIHLVLGLVPGVGYAVSTSSAPGGVSVRIAPGGEQVADAAGVLVVGP